ncbi:hypothetical protein HanXRQr2_Chr02g0074321 [Helianthus annuus]|nr:hypothetical protein HanXRQr2_Chr02g0074321 [Helianthus annuus]KAJ0605350.1 hypothetical protein HanHA300_Chr02g0062051 [Helianthus annuus]KAJ0619366.1 hypothetical protein HanHA89_Chr02g0070561 [Helianthus annuus]
MKKSHTMLVHRSSLEIEVHDGAVWPCFACRARSRKHLPCTSRISKLTGAARGSRRKHVIATVSFEPLHIHRRLPEDPYSSRRRPKSQREPRHVSFG